MPDDPIRLPPAELTAHQQPALMVAAITACDEASGAGELLPGPWDALQLSEGCAQTMACLMGVRIRRRAAAGEGAAAPAAGMLVGLKEVACRRDAAAGEVVRVRTMQTHALGPFQLIRAEAVGADGEVILSGEWKTMSTAGAGAP